MTVRTSLLSFLSMLALVGCLSDEKKVTDLSTSPFRNAVRTQAASFKQAPPATQEVALRVDRIGKQIVSTNARLNQQKVAFLTLGAPKVEIFHQSQKDSSVVYITEGLVKQCKTDGELAAVLSQELGKLVSEQIAETKTRRNDLDRPPLLTPRVGNDIGGTFGAADGSDQMILAHLEKERQQIRPSLATAPPPPAMLARIYMQGAGFDSKDLDTVAPLLRQADKENGLEQSMTGKPGS